MNKWLIKTIKNLIFDSLVCSHQLLSSMGKGLFSNMGYIVSFLCLINFKK